MILNSTTPWVKNLQKYLSELFSKKEKKIKIISKKENTNKLKIETN